MIRSLALFFAISSSLVSASVPECEFCDDVNLTEARPSQEKSATALSLYLAIDFDPQLQGLVFPTLSGVQKVLEGNKQNQVSSLLGQGAMLYKLQDNLEQLALNNTEVITELVCQVGVIGSNIFLFHGTGMDKPSSRFYYSVLKAPAAIKSEFKKYAKKQEKTTSLIDKGRHLSFFGSECLNLVFKHKKYLPGLMAVTAYKSAHFFYEYAIREPEEEDSSLWNSLRIQSLALATVFALQVPLIYAGRDGFHGFVLGAEFILMTLYYARY